MKIKLDEYLAENNLEYHGLHNLEKFINGNFARTKKGIIKYPIELPQSILKDEVTGIPLGNKDYKLIPLLLFVSEIKSKERE